VSAARQFQVEDREPTLADFLENISLASDTDAHDTEKDSVSVMTLHAAKGLEFPVVYMLAMEQGILPHDRSLENDEELQEERRLAFVGMTRAMHELYLCNARMRDFRGSVMFTAPSMFLGQLPEAEIKVIEEGPGSAMDAMLRGPGKDSQMTQGWRSNQLKAPVVAPISPMPVKDGNYSEGLVVKHPAYGKGIITEVSGYGAMRRLKIRFQTAGERSFIADKVQLEIVRNQ
jgi:DNA helicase-2/ATP-dependent DNA helicase PcrA